MILTLQRKKEEYVVKERVRTVIVAATVIYQKGNRKHIISGTKDVSSPYSAHKGCLIQHPCSQAVIAPSGGHYLRDS